jgi:hypothetical protein
MSAPATSERYAMSAIACAKASSAAFYFSSASAFIFASAMARLSSS